jgi:hypothetical protein
MVVLTKQVACLHAANCSATLAAHDLLWSAIHASKTDRDCLYYTEYVVCYTLYIEI